MDLEVGAPGAASYGHMEGHRSDLDHVFVTEHGPLDANSVDSSFNHVIKALKDPFWAIF